MRINKTVYTVPWSSSKTPSIPRKIWKGRDGSKSQKFLEIVASLRDRCMSGNGVKAKRRFVPGLQ